MDWQSNESKRIILDNGSHMIRCGQANSLDPSVSILNLVAQQRKTGQFTYGSELEQLFDEKQVIHYIKPLIRGVLVNIDKEIMLWEQMFKSKELESHSLSLTYHPQTPEKVLNKMCEVAFEYFGFDAFYPALSQKMILKYLTFSGQINTPFSLIVESSHSATYITPFFDGEIMDGGIRRIDVGGRLLTNQLKELISLKSFEFKNYYLLTNQIKEEVCYVSTNFKQDIKNKKGSSRKYFILPDYDVIRRGYSLDQIDPASLNPRIDFDKERIKIPEIIFTPSDIGLNQKGLIPTIKEVIRSMHPDLGGYFLENIFLTGGNVQFQNFRERFYSDIRSETDQSLNVNVNQIDDLNVVFKGTVVQSRDNDFQDLVITKKMYQENGFQSLFTTYFQ